MESGTAVVKGAAVTISPMERWEWSQSIPVENATQRACLVALSWQADKDTLQTYLAIKTITERACCDRKAAIRALKRLEELSLIDREIRPGRSTIYTLIIGQSNRGVLSTSPQSGTTTSPQSGTTPVPKAAHDPSPYPGETIQVSSKKRKSPISLGKEGTGKPAAPQVLPPSTGQTLASMGCRPKLRGHIAGRRARDRNL